MSTKGDWSRPQSVTNEELELRHDYMEQKIDRAEYDRKFEDLMKRGLIRRNGRIICYDKAESSDEQAEDKPAPKKTGTTQTDEGVDD